MSFFDGLTPTYTFRLQIERSDRPILDTEIIAKGTPEEIAKAKKNVQRLLADYTPTFKAPEPVPTPAPEADAPALPEPEAQAPAAEQQQQDKPAEATAPQRTAPVVTRKPVGARGLLRLHCPECGNTFGTYLREYQEGMDCKCGHHIDLTGQLGRYRFTCPYCEKETWGLTNLEDPEITIQCKCGGDVELRWNPKAKEYQN